MSKFHFWASVNHFRIIILLSQIINLVVRHWKGLYMQVMWLDVAYRIRSLICRLQGSIELSSYSHTDLYIRCQRFLLHSYIRILYTFATHRYSIFQSQVQYKCSYQPPVICYPYQFKLFTFKSETSIVA